ncbi:uroporphyrinogen decarboxylase [Helicobacter ailurogastricus]|uniref:Uroporphyrinogen decarboxylase n=1 Tax=Helicobacter ailurogastricus TaxID=1578720 RepID=A0A0K2Y0C2_9HELI|nr:uroporphyrinogen decarboxylase [Helicobacter ailurogastricus]BDQ29474.1 uroporphyrinogen decarboxylase [Helicobacter ailurogastricus]CRF52348.1 Uroporphyrinogen III decarboxylase [Helicobacter ailurogastricus]
MIFIDACFRQETPYTPIWLMRQAGRYLSEYQEVRKQAKSFLDLCADVKRATEVTLQPIEILDVDAAILFSDILLLPHAMGLPLEFIPGFGPKFTQTITSLEDIRALKRGAYKDLGFVYEIVSSVRSALGKSKALIGFSGAPWTLATYMLEGQGSKTYSQSKKILYSQPEAAHALLEALSQEIIHYLDAQAQAGANALMLFDSWAGALELEAYLDFGWGYVQKITKTLKAKHPKTPLIVFPKGVGAYLGHLKGDFEVFGCDWGVPLKLAKEMLGDCYVLQGNLEPARLYSQEAMLEGVKRIFEVMGKKAGFIFNLGHGMLPDLPRAHATQLVRLVREISQR